MKLWRDRDRVKTSIIGLSALASGLTFSLLIMASTTFRFAITWWMLLLAIPACIWIGMRTYHNQMTVYRRGLGELEEDPAARLRRRADRVVSAVNEARIVMDELQRDLAAQQAARDALLAQADAQRKLLEINKEQAEIIQQIILSENRKAATGQKRRDWVMLFAGLLLGALVSIPISIAIELYTPTLQQTTPTTGATPETVSPRLSPPDTPASARPTR